MHELNFQDRAAVRQSLLSPAEGIVLQWGVSSLRTVPCSFSPPSPPSPLSPLPSCPRFARVCPRLARLALASVHRREGEKKREKRRNRIFGDASGNWFGSQKVFSSPRRRCACHARIRHGNPLHPHHARAVLVPGCCWLVDRTQEQHTPGRLQLCATLCLSSGCGRQAVDRTAIRRDLPSICDATGDLKRELANWKIVPKP